MYVKKIVTSLIVGLSCIASSYAGDMGPVASGPLSGLYVEGNVGYAYHPWQSDRATTVGLENQLGVLTNLSNINGGATGGVDLGYYLIPSLAVEGGWYYLPQASYNRIRTVTLPVAATTFTLPEGLQVNINSGMAYVAVKGLIPIYNQLNAFAKFGAAYTYNNTNVNVPASLVSSPTVYTVDHSNFWNPLLAVGLEYSLISNFLCNVQYNYIPGYETASTSHFIAPPTQLITFGLGYKFS